MDHTRLTLASGQWFEVKNKMRVSDKEDVHSYAVDGVSADRDTYRFNVVKHQVATAAARIVNWGGFNDERNKAIQWPTGKPFRDKLAVIKGLDEDVFEAVYDALSTHLAAIELEAAEEKKETADGVTDATSSSPSAG